MFYALIASLSDIAYESYVNGSADYGVTIIDLDEVTDEGYDLYYVAGDTLYGLESYFRETYDYSDEDIEGVGFAAMWAN